MGQEGPSVVNLFRQELGGGAVFRLIPSSNPDSRRARPPRLDRLALCGANGDFILVTGPTGSGKSTTLAAILDRINKRLPYHVVTIEDPIEFVHTNDRIVSSRSARSAPTFRPSPRR
jgi:twitching motility protein PilT